jgi:hypothetical protein
MNASRSPARHRPSAAEDGRSRPPARPKPSRRKTKRPRGGRGRLVFRGFLRAEFRCVVSGPCRGRPSRSTQSSCAPPFLVRCATTVPAPWTHRQRIHRLTLENDRLVFGAALHVRVRLQGLLPLAIPGRQPGSKKRGAPVGTAPGARLNTDLCPVGHFEPDTDSKSPPKNSLRLDVRSAGIDSPGEPAIDFRLSYYLWILCRWPPSSPGLVPLPHFTFDFVFMIRPLGCGMRRVARLLVAPWPRTPLQHRCRSCGGEQVGDIARLCS